MKVYYWQGIELFVHSCGVDIRCQQNTSDCTICNAIPMIVVTQLSHTTHEPAWKWQFSPVGELPSPRSGWYCGVSVQENERLSSRISLHKAIYHHQWVSLTAFGVFSQWYLKWTIGVPWIAQLTNMASPCLLLLASRLSMISRAREIVLLGLWCILFNQYWNPNTRLTIWLPFYYQNMCLSNRFSFSCSFVEARSLKWRQDNQIINQDGSVFL